MKTGEKKSYALSSELSLRLNTENGQYIRKHHLFCLCGSSIDFLSCFGIFAISGGSRRSRATSIPFLFVLFASKSFVVIASDFEELLEMRSAIECSLACGVVIKS